MGEKWDEMPIFQSHFPLVAGVACRFCAVGYRGLNMHHHQFGRPWDCTPHPSTIIRTSRRGSECW